MSYCLLFCKFHIHFSLFTLTFCQNLPLDSSTLWLRTNSTFQCNFQPLPVET